MSYRERFQKLFDAIYHVDLIVTHNILANRPCWTPQLRSLAEQAKKIIRRPMLALNRWASSQQAPKLETTPFQLGIIGSPCVVARHGSETHPRAPLPYRQQLLL